MHDVMPKIKMTAAFAAVALCITACQSLDQAAPQMAGSEQLAHGRTIYVTKCAKCHAPEPVRNYSVASWEEIIPEMALETKLSAAETAAVHAYVMAVLRAPTSS